MVEGAFQEAVRRALVEDRAREDVTTQLLKAWHSGTAQAAFVAEQRLVVCGLPAVLVAATELDPAAQLVHHAHEGDWAAAGQSIATVTAAAPALLSAERVALNFLQHLSGVATATRLLVEAVAGTSAKITHTRKTTPGLRDLEIYAVTVGGGVLNRASLADAIMWKDNHWALIDAAAQRRPDTPQLREVLAGAPHGIEVIVEVEGLEQLDAALEAGVRHLLVDNQTPQRLAEFVRRAGADVTIQASGGITLANVRAYAEAGAQLIAIGALTHSAAATSISCELQRFARDDG